MLERITTKWIPSSGGITETRFVGLVLVAKMIIGADGKEVSWLDALIFILLCKLSGSRLETRQANTHH